MEKMKDSRMYHAKDRRVYNGALSDDMLRETHNKTELFAKLKKLEPRIVSTYFPLESYYMISIRHEDDRSLWFEELSFERNHQVAIIKATAKLSN